MATGMESSQIRVLLVAGGAAEPSAIKDFLQQGSPLFRVQHYDDPQTAMDFLLKNEADIDIILLNLGLVEYQNAEDVFQQIHQVVSNIPVIIFTGTTEQDLAMLLMKEGSTGMITRKTFIASPEKLKETIKLSLSGNEPLRKRIERNPAALAKSAAGLKELNMKHLADLHQQVLSWMNGGYSIDSTIADQSRKENGSTAPELRKK
jgi:DNA-binding NarL/FixJ family response regulator